MALVARDNRGTMKEALLASNERRKKTYRSSNPMRWRRESHRCEIVGRFEGPRVLRVRRRRKADQTDARLGAGFMPWDQGAVVFSPVYAA